MDLLTRSDQRQRPLRKARALSSMIVLALIGAGCEGFRPAALDAGRDLPVADGSRDGWPAADGRPSVDGSADAQRADGAAIDGPRQPDLGPPPDGSAPDGDAGAIGGPCRPLPLPCLDPSDQKVIEVPTEVDGPTAFATAQAGDTIQIRGLKLAAGWWIPSYVTLRGCQGAEIVGNIGFAGSGGVVEGFTVSGAGEIVLNRTGTYVVRYNRIVGGSQPTAAPGVSALSTEALVSADVEALVDSNWFEGRTKGLEARTSYDTGVRAVRITVRNNIFDGVDRPITLSEGGLVGKITATIEHNTLHDFDVGLSFYSLNTKPVISGVLLSSGNQGVQASAAVYEVQHSLIWQVATAHDTAPIAGAFASGDPAFVSATSADFRLQLTSAALDRIPTSAAVPSEDYHGCPRPVAATPGSPARADIGALETQRP